MRTAVVTTVHPAAASLAVGSHHVARELARRGWRVLLLSDPCSLVHVMAAPFSSPAAVRLRAAMAGPVGTPGGMQELTPLTFAPLAGRFGAGSAASLRLWPAFTLPRLGPWLDRHGFREPDLLLLDGPLMGHIQAWIRPRRTLLRVFDDPSGRIAFSPALLDLERRIAVTADLVVVTAPALQAFAASLGATRVHLMPNGVDLPHFRQPTVLPLDLASIPPPRIVYAGAIAPWIDQRLMDVVTARMPEASFVWIGPGQPPDRRRPNEHWLGPRPFDDLPAYLQHCDAAIIPFDRANHCALVDSIHPLKLYDYLASGLPVVATPWRELQRMASPAVLAEGAADFVEALRAALAGGRPNAGAFLEAATWSRRVDDLFAALEGGLVAPRGEGVPGDRRP